MNEKLSQSRRELRERILLEANVAFMQRGIKGLKMDDLANMMGISKRTLYELFEDKESLLVACIHNNNQNNENFMRELVATSSNVIEVILRGYKRSIEVAHKTNPSFFGDIQKYPKAYEALTNRHNRDSSRVIEFFKMGVEQGMFRSDVHFPIFSELVTSWLKLMLNTDIVHKYSFLEVYESIMFTALRGISTEKGAAVLENFIEEYRKNTTIRDLITNK